MKVITLKQPYATLISEGLKKYEFRTWKTSYRGELLIHAGKGIDKDAMKRVSSLNLTYPKSKILCKVNLVDCIKCDESFKKELYKSNPLVYSNGKFEGYIWILEDVEKVMIDEEIKGKLSFWEYKKKTIK